MIDETTEDAAKACDEDGDEVAVEIRLLMDAGG